MQPSKIFDISHFFHTDEESTAIRVFMLNTQVFLRSAIVWDSLAEAHMKAGDMKRPNGITKDL